MHVDVPYGIPDYFYAWVGCEQCGEPNIERAVRCPSCGAQERVSDGTSVELKVPSVVWSPTVREGSDGSLVVVGRPGEKLAEYPPDTWKGYDLEVEWRRSDRDYGDDYFE